MNGFHILTAYLYQVLYNQFYMWFILKIFSKCQDEGPYCCCYFVDKENKFLSS